MESIKKTIRLLSTIITFVLNAIALFNIVKTFCRRTLFENAIYSSLGFWLSVICIVVSIVILVFYFKVHALENSIKLYEKLAIYHKLYTIRFILMHNLMARNYGSRTADKYFIRPSLYSANKITYSYTIRGYTGTSICDIETEIEIKLKYKYLPKKSGYDFLISHDEGKEIVDVRYRIEYDEQPSPYKSARYSLIKYESVDSPNDFEKVEIPLLNQSGRNVTLNLKYTIKGGFDTSIEQETLNIFPFNHAKRTKELEARITFINTDNSYPQLAEMRKITYTDPTGSYDKPLDLALTVQKESEKTYICSLPPENNSLYFAEFTPQKS